jgi:general secretion pathway protein K
MIKTQKGVALVVVLLIVALVSIIATELSQNLQRETRRSANVFDQMQAKRYVLGAEGLALGVLQQQVKDSPKRDDLDQAWATQGVVYPVEGGSLAGVIKDKNQCFNLNSLVENKSKGTEQVEYVANKTAAPYLLYRQLLLALGLDQGLSDPLIDWLDSDSDASGLDGAEDLDYELNTPAYRAANTLMADVSELRLLKGYTPEVIKKLMPYVCVLPQANYLKLNANTINSEQPELLIMLVKGLSIDGAKAILGERARIGYENVEAFWQQSQLAGLEVTDGAKAILQLDSDYFELQANAKIGRGHAYLTTLLKQQGNDTVQIVSRQFGGAQ